MKKIKLILSSICSKIECIKIKIGQTVDVQKTKIYDMESIKEQMIKVIQEQPEDSSFDEILRELAFAQMIERGLADSDNKRTIKNEEMKRRIRSWQKSVGQPKPKNG